jgi:hypothetical protein
MMQDSDRTPLLSADRGDALLVPPVVRPTPSEAAPSDGGIRGQKGEIRSRVEDHMTLRLVSSGDDRALAIRDHLVPLVRDRGRLELQQGSVRLVGFQSGPWVIQHWTPFSELDTGEASSRGYRHALERQHGRSNLPYGLDVWHDGAKVLSVLWADDGASEVASFVRGSWEDEALAL